VKLCRRLPTLLQQFKAELAAYSTTSSSKSYHKLEQLKEQLHHLFYPGKALTDPLQLFDSATIAPLLEWGILHMAAFPANSGNPRLQRFMPWTMAQHYCHSTSVQLEGMEQAIALLDCSRCVSWRLGSSSASVDVQLHSLSHNSASSMRDTHLIPATIVKPFHNDVPRRSKPLRQQYGIAITG
jgi:hypothetical protein